MQAFVDWLTGSRWLRWVADDGIGVGLFALYVTVAIGSLVAIPVLYLLGY